MHAVQDKTLLLVDSPNTLVLFSRQADNQSSITSVAAQLDEKITDFCLKDEATLLYSTVDQIYAYSLAEREHVPLVRAADRCLVEDHYLTQLAYLPGAGRLLAVSALRPVDPSRYPFTGMEADAILAEEARQRPEHIDVSASGAQADGAALTPQVMRAFGVSSPPVQQQPQMDPQQPRTVASVFQQEWRDLMKFITISHGSTELPEGIEATSFRPGNLPKKSEEEVARANQLVEENRRQYLERQRLKQEEARKRVEDAKAKEERLAKEWEEQILVDYDNLKSTARVRDLWTEGIPNRIRPIVWYRAIGNKSVVTKDLFNIMAERGRKLADLLKKHQSLETKICENGGRPADVDSKI